MCPRKIEDAIRQTPILVLFDEAQGCLAPTPEIPLFPAEIRDRNGYKQKESF